MIGDSNKYRGSLESARLRLGVAALTMLSFALIPAVAAAQSVDPTDAQYGDSLVQLSQGASGGGPGASADSSSVGDLPFTGLDVALLAAVAAALVLVGLLLRSRRPADSPQA